MSPEDEAYFRGIHFSRPKRSESLERRIKAGDMCELPEVRGDAPAMPAGSLHPPADRKD